MTTEEKIRRALERHGDDPAWTDVRIAKCCGCRMVDVAAMRGYTASPRQASAPAAPSAPTEELGLTLADEREARLIGLLRKKPRSVEVLSEILDCSASRIHALIESLQGKGYDVVASEDGHTARLLVDATPPVEPIDLQDLEGDEVNFTFFSDPHAGSKFQQLTMWNAMAEISERRGARFLCCAGDVFDGRSMYRGHEQEIFLHGADDQRDYVVEKFPRYEQIYTIPGNHDMKSYKGTVGYNIVRHLCMLREDWHYCGDTVGEFLLPEGLRVQMRHPSGGTSYARSYRLQKINEGLGRKEDLPDLILIGHYHISLYMHYLGIPMLGGGTLQAQTSYLADKGMDVDLGFWNISLSWSKKAKGLNWIEPRWYDLSRFVKARNW